MELALKWRACLEGGDYVEGFGSMQEAAAGRKVFAASLMHPGGHYLVQVCASGLNYSRGAGGGTRSWVKHWFRVRSSKLLIESRVFQMADMRAEIYGAREQIGQSLLLETRADNGRLLRVGWRVNLKTLQVEPVSHDDPDVIVERCV